MKSFSHLLFLGSLALVLCVLVGCDSGMITASAVDAPMRRIIGRDENAVTADPKLTDLQRRVYLRDDAEVRAILDAAKPSTQPVK